MSGTESLKKLQESPPVTQACGPNPKWVKRLDESILGQMGYLVGSNTVPPSLVWRQKPVGSLLP
jgi:hypothetical protein